MSDDFDRAAEKIEAAGEDLRNPARQLAQVREEALAQADRLDKLADTLIPDHPAIALTCRNDATAMRSQANRLAAAVTAVAGT